MNFNIGEKIRDKLLSKISKKIYWNLRAINFDKEWSGHQSKYFDQHIALKNIVKDIKPNNILDVGCGFGRNIKFLIEECNVRPCNITAIDFSINMIQKAKSFLGDNFYKLREIKEASILDIPYSDNGFDMVLVHGVMMHIDFNDISRAISEVLRVSNGYIVQVEEYYKDKVGAKINNFTYCHDYFNLYANKDIIDLDMYNKNLIMLVINKSCE